MDTYGLEPIPFGNVVSGFIDFVQVGSINPIQELITRIALEGIPEHYREPAAYLAMFAWYGWDELVDTQALAVIKNAMASRDKKGSVSSGGFVDKSINKEGRILRNVPVDGHTLNQDLDPSATLSPIVTEERLLANLVDVQEQVEATNFTGDEIERFNFLNSLSDEERESKGLLEEWDTLNDKLNENERWKEQRYNILSSLFGWEDDSSQVDNIHSAWGQVPGIEERQLRDRFDIHIEGFAWSQDDTPPSYDDLAWRLEAIYNYQQGAEIVADWLTETFPSEFSDMDADEAFRATFPSITINRTEDRPDEVNKAAKGYTHGSMVDDYFDDTSDDGIDNPFRRAMTIDNFVHELFHVFVNKGELRRLENQLDFDTSVTVDNLADLPSTMFGILEENEAEDRQGDEQPSENVFAPNEIVANFLAADALGTLGLTDAQIQTLAQYGYFEGLQATLGDLLSDD